MAMDPDQYDPQYAEIHNLPFRGPDDYTDQEKRRAIYEAETRLEMDVNSGRPIPDDELTDAHRVAVLLYGTYRLTSSAESASDVTLGDIQNTSGAVNREDYDEAFKQDYNELVELINENGGPDEGGGVYYGADGEGGSVVVNTRDDDIRFEYPFDENNRFPND